MLRRYRFLFVSLATVVVGCTTTPAAPDGRAPDQDVGTRSDAGAHAATDATGGDAGPCVPTTCALAHADCGRMDDGCGIPLDCGTCTDPDVCGAGGPHVCGVPSPWRNITPEGANPGDSRGFSAFAVDPNDSNILYAGQCGEGVWKSMNAGVTWRRMGDPSEVAGATTGYLDNPVFIEVDPRDSRHLYANDAGWCGSFDTLGFWESFDGGDNWTSPIGFQHAEALPGSSADVGRFDVDPGDFDHILISMRYTPDPSFGFLESTDGGDTFVLHAYPMETAGGTKGVNFLHEPSLGIGSGQTWLISSEAQGFARTEDGGNTWTLVGTTFSGIHGGVSRIHYAPDGTLYYGATPNPLRSPDNGLTWEAIPMLFGYWQVIVGDGNLMYTMPVGSDVQLLSSLENDGLTWSPTGKVFHHNALLTFDRVGRVLYATGLDGVEAYDVGPATAP